MDRLTSAQRSHVMRRVKSKNTTPELIVRRLLHSCGYRFRLHLAGIPGTPDLVFASRKKIVLVHGCFWHSHKGCPHFRRPKSNLSFWAPKLKRNIARDIRVIRALKKLGWKTKIVWECETTDSDRLGKKLKKFLQ
jgi:DNA mismatch endonuclease (patch repair protein)